jgi:hypothetical protein
MKWIAVAAAVCLAVACGGSSDPGDSKGTGGGGGSSAAGGGGGTSSSSDVGKTCQKNGDCSRNLCLFKGTAQFGYCTKECESFSECPTFWDCKEVGNASGKYCVQN